MNRALEHEIRRLAGNRCEYCGLPESFIRLKFTLDHVVARQHGGLDNLENLALACGYCNRHKGPNIAGIDPETGTMSRLFHPRSDVWLEHFRWQGAELIGVTPAGRATIAVLDMNGRYQISIRRAMMNEGIFGAPEP
jgi:hypothetical protein